MMATLEYSSNIDVIYPIERGIDYKTIKAVSLLIKKVGLKAKLYVVETEGETEGLWEKVIIEYYGKVNKHRIPTRFRFIVERGEKIVLIDDREIERYGKIAEGWVGKFDIYDNRGDINKRTARIFREYLNFMSVVSYAGLELEGILKRIVQKTERENPWIAVMGYKLTVNVNLYSLEGKIIVEREGKRIGFIKSVIEYDTLEGLVKQINSGKWLVPRVSMTIEGKFIDDDIAVGLCKMIVRRFNYMRIRGHKKIIEL